MLEVLTWPAVGMNKISVLLLYKRIFATTHFKKMVWVLVAGVIAWTITFTLALMRMSIGLFYDNSGREKKLTFQSRVC